MTSEALLVTLFFLLPGLVTLAVFEWIFVGRDRSAVELTSWAVGISVAAAAPLVLIPKTRPLVDYLWNPTSLSATALGGVGLHVLSGVLLAVAVGLVAKNVFDGRLGAKSFYRRSGDWLWGNYGNESRYLTVQANGELYYGQLAFADDPSVGTDVVIRDPAVWDEAEEDFYRSGMKYLLIPGDCIEQLELSVASPMTESDRPYYGIGFVGEANGEVTQSAGGRDGG